MLILVKDSYCIKKANLIAPGRGWLAIMPEMEYDDEALFLKTIIDQSQADFTIIFICPSADG